METMSSKSLRGLAHGTSPAGTTVNDYRVPQKIAAGGGAVIRQFQHL